MKYPTRLFYYSTQKFIFRNKVVLRGHTIPHAVLTRSIYSEHFENHPNPNINVEPFLKTIASNLRAFLSRKQQCDALQNR